MLWDRKSSKAVHNAIVWQDRRTTPDCERLKQQGLAEVLRDKTGLVIRSLLFCEQNWLGYLNLKLRFMRVQSSER